MSSPKITNLQNLPEAAHVSRGITHFGKEHSNVTDVSPTNLVKAQIKNPSSHPSLSRMSADSVPTFTSLSNQSYHQTSMVNNIVIPELTHEENEKILEKLLEIEQSSADYIFSITLETLNSQFDRLLEGVFPTITKYTKREGHFVFLDNFEKELHSIAQSLPSFFKEWFPKILRPNRADIWIRGFIYFPHLLKLDGIDITASQFRQLIYVCERIIILLLQEADFYSKFVFERIEFDANIKHPKRISFLKTLTGYKTFPNAEVMDNLTLIMSFARTLPAKGDLGIASPHFESLWSIIKGNFNPEDAFDTNLRTLDDLNKTLNDQLHVYKTQLIPFMSFETMLLTSTIMEEYSHIAPGSGETEFANIVVMELNRVIDEGRDATFNTNCLSQWYAKYAQGSWLTNKDKLSVTSLSSEVPRKRVLYSSGFEWKNITTTEPKTYSSRPNHRFLPRGVFKFIQPPLAEFSYPWCSTCGYGHESGKHIFIDNKLIPEFPADEKEKLIRVDKALAQIHTHLKRKPQYRKKRKAQFKSKSSRHSS
ncbi:hypothetical protein CANINC_000321 [Pichia inconspicua]|uniref:Uncharacterized protein n=1 Tax=Pichia inconspicua TaxID=52247 RepID=A0A4T0X7L0_9ASCO|nr:hypothetical protein CANINC_000321 [[Candida] inconspicua]